MFKRCRHKWTEVNRTFNPPASVTSIENASNDFALKCCYGFTNIEMKCDICGDAKVVQTNGSAAEKSTDVSI